MSSDQVRALINKSRLLQQKMDEQQAFLKDGGTKALRGKLLNEMDKL